MAKQKGIIKLEGKIGDLSFLKTQDGYLAREKGGVDAEKIKTSAAFVRTRENNAEFTSSAQSGKLLRDAIRPMLLLAGDSRVTSRLTQVMTSIKNMDTVSDRGARKVGTGISDPAAKLLLKGFNFNRRSSMGSILFGSYQVDIASGDISFTNLITAHEIKPLPGATHVGFQSCRARVNFADGTQQAEFSDSVVLPVTAQPYSFNLLPAGVPTGTGTDLYLLLIEFFQEVNGTNYPLKNGAYNVLAIVEIE